MPTNIHSYRYIVSERGIAADCSAAISKQNSFDKTISIAWPTYACFAVNKSIALEWPRARVAGWLMFRLAG